MSERPYSPTNTDDEVHLRLRGNVEVASGTSSPLETNLILLRGKVLLHVLLSALEDNLALGLCCLCEKIVVSRCCRGSRNWEE